MVKKRKRSKILFFTLLTLISMVFAFVNINRLILCDKLAKAKSKEECAKTFLEEEKKRTKELEALKLDMKTKKFAEEVARKKFGLTYKNEIIFEPEK